MYVTTWICNLLIELPTYLVPQFVLAEQKPHFLQSFMEKSREVRFGHHWGARIATPCWPNHQWGMCLFEEYAQVIAVV
jgi:hypothetical protein